MNLHVSKFTQLKGLLRYLPSNYRKNFGNPRRLGKAARLLATGRPFSTVLALAIANIRPACDDGAFRFRIA